MRYAIFEIATGQIDRIVTAPFSVGDSCAPGEDFIAAENGELDTTHYVVNNELVELPTRPSLFHEWDATSRAWVGNVVRVRAYRHKQIEDARDKRLNEPVIEYNGMLLDAGPQAKQNLQDKVTATNSRIARGTPTPVQTLVWKDHENQIHAFSDLVAYRDWLEGFVIELENRGMQAWAWSWQLKDRLAALTTLDAVLAFDTTPPW